MKRILFLITTLVISISAFTQIPSQHSVQGSIFNTYDSLTNYLSREKISSYIGQYFYVKPKNERLRDGGYKDFYTHPEEERSFAYKADKYGNTYYNNLAGKTFKVIDVVKGKGVLYNDFIKLSDGKDEFYYLYTNYEHSFPFLVIGHIEKLKKEYARRWYYFTNAPDEYWNDFRTGLPVPLISGSTWFCQDIILDNKYFWDLKCVLQNERGEVISNTVNRMKFNFILKDYGDVLSRRYGSMYTSAIKGDILKGMPEELVIISRGEPKKINRSSHGEQWVYSSNYIYFSNGKVTGWN